MRRLLGILVTAALLGGCSGGGATAQRTASPSGSPSPTASVDGLAVLRAAVDKAHGAGTVRYTGTKKTDFGLGSATVQETGAVDIAGKRASVDTEMSLSGRITRLIPGADQIRFPLRSAVRTIGDEAYLSFEQWRTGRSPYGKPWLRLTGTSTAEAAGQYGLSFEATGLPAAAEVLVRDAVIAQRKPELDARGGAGATAYEGTAEGSRDLALAISFASLRRLVEAGVPDDVFTRERVNFTMWLDAESRPARLEFDATNFYRRLLGRVLAPTPSQAAPEVHQLLRSLKITATYTFSRYGEEARISPPPAGEVATR